MAGGEAVPTNRQRAGHAQGAEQDAADALDHLAVADRLDTVGDALAAQDSFCPACTPSVGFATKPQVLTRCLVGRHFAADWQSKSKVNASGVAQWQERRDRTMQTNPVATGPTVKESVSKESNPPSSSVPVFKPWKPDQPARLQPFKAAQPA